MIGQTPFCPMCGAAKSTDKCSRCGAEMHTCAADSRAPAEVDHIANPGKMIEAVKRDKPL